MTDTLAMLRLPARALSAALVSGALYGALEALQVARPLGDDDDDVRRERFVRRWARASLAVLRVDARIDPGPSPRDTLPRAPRLVVANHRSTIDILLLLDLFGGHLLARGDMADWPVFGRLARTGGTLFVDRADPASGAAAVQRVRERLRRGKTIGVFPEGTTFDDDEVRPFHAGAFVAAAREKAEVLPVGIAYEGGHAIFGDEPAGAHFARLLRAPKTRVAVAIGAGFSAAGTPIAATCERAHAEVQTLVRRARAMLP